jgi:DNA-binding LacI/PurR family transcriptional regulator
VELILSRIDDPAAPPREFTAPFAIVERESTA